METLIQALKAINDVIWGPGMLILLIGTGLYLTVGLRFYTFRNIFSAFSMPRPLPAMPVMMWALKTRPACCIRAIWV